MHYYIIIYVCIIFFKISEVDKWLANYTTTANQVNQVLLLEYIEDDGLKNSIESKIFLDFLCFLQKRWLR